MDQLETTEPVVRQLRWVNRNFKFKVLVVAKAYRRLLATHLLQASKTSRMGVVLIYMKMLTVAKAHNDIQDHGGARIANRSQVADNSQIKVENWRDPRIHARALLRYAHTR